MGMSGYETESFGFEDLEVYQVARAFRKRVYKLIALLPVEERFALGQQMRRSAASITSNIAEGHGRYNWQDNTRFCRLARGSLCETVDQINTCIDQQYAKPEHLENLKSEAIRVQKLINGYIRYLQKQKER